MQGFIFLLQVNELSLSVGLCLTQDPSSAQTHNLGCHDCHHLHFSSVSFWDHALPSTTEKLRKLKILSQKTCR